MDSENVIREFVSFLQKDLTSRARLRRDLADVARLAGIPANQYRYTARADELEAIRDALPGLVVAFCLELEKEQRSGAESGDEAVQQPV